MAGSTVILGNQYLAWFETAVVGTFAALKGQGSYSETRNPTKIDTSDKTTQGYNTGAFGNISYDGSLDVRVNLPDTTYTRIESLSNAQTPINFQLRKNGLAGQLADAIFAGLVYISIASRTFTKDGTVDVKMNLSLAAAPSVDTLA